MTPDSVTLEDLRQRVNDLDRQLIALIAERKTVSEEVARVKRATGKPTRDYEREREVIMGVRAIAAERGVSPQLAEQLLRLLIRSSLTTQEQASVVAHGAGSGRRALVIGGAGKMGSWFVSFLVSQGFSVEIGIEFCMMVLLGAFKHLFKSMLRHLKHGTAEHLDQPAIGVIREARIVAALGQRLNGLVVQAQVQNRVHHAGHRELGARTH